MASEGRSQGSTCLAHFQAEVRKEAWGNDAERTISRGKSAVGVEADVATTFGFVIDLHRRDLAEVERYPLSYI